MDKGVEGTTDNTKKFELKISKARALEYIISYNMKRKRTTDDVVKILDIEPAKVVGDRDIDSETIKKKVKKSFDTNGKTVTHTSITMPTTEFIGRTEDLSDYDLIYMGLDTSNFNTTDKILLQEVVPQKVIPEQTIEESWITEEHKHPTVIHNEVVAEKTEIIDGTDKGFKRPSYTKPGYTIPKTLNKKMVNGIWVYRRPKYTIPGYTIPASREVWRTTIYNDSNMNGLIYSNVGDIYKDHDSGTMFMGGLLDTDYVKIGTRYNNIEAYKDADPNSDGIKLNYKANLAELDYHNGSTYENKTYTGDINFRFPGNDITEEKLRKIRISYCICRWLCKRAGKQYNCKCYKD